MNENLDLDLVIYGSMLVGLGVLAHKLAPGLGYATLLTGVVAGVLTAAFGLVGLRRLRRRVWPIGTLVVVVAALLVQMIRAWLAVKAGTGSAKPAAMILTVLVVFGIGQLLNLAKAKP